MNCASTCDAARADSFRARYYSSMLGRFMTPDWSAAPEAVPYANLANPQSLNLYSYVLNNPTTATDSDGHCPTCLTEAIVDWINFKIAHPAAAARIEQGAEGAALVAGGAVTLAAVATAGVAGAPETGGASVLAAVAGGGAAAGMFAAGGTELVAAVTGHSPPGLSGAVAAVQTVANPAGLVTTAVTGSLADGEKAAAATDVAAGAVGAATAATTLEKAAAAVGSLQIVIHVHAECKEQTPCAGVGAAAPGGSPKSPGGGR